MKKAYYARCIAIDGTKQFHRDLDLIRRLGYQPDDRTPEQKSEGYKKEGMEFFLNIIRNESDILFFRAMPGGKIGAGVFKEIQEAQKKGIPILELPSMILSREMTVAQTREYLTDIGQR